MILCAVLGAAAVGCGHEEARTTAQVVVPPSLSLDAALAAAKHGEKGPWNVEGFVAKRVDDGGLLLSRTGNLSSRQPVAGVDPAALAAQTSTLLASDPLVATSGIRVDADDTGRVVLHGKVPNQSIAAQAVHDAMRVPAVLAVESRLEW